MAYILDDISLATDGYASFCDDGQYWPSALPIATLGIVVLEDLRPPNRILLAGDGGVSLARRQEQELMRIVPLAIAAIEEIENSD